MSLLRLIVNTTITMNHNNDNKHVNDNICNNSTDNNDDNIYI